MPNLLLAVYLPFTLLLLSPFCRGNKCPPIYKRFSETHSCFLPKNSTCCIFQSSVEKKEIKEILDVYNKYRNLVATGKEKRAGGLPKAADMMQMVWDPELATLAQKKADQCTFTHDCNDCRRVENFHVGQNMAKKPWKCSNGNDCQKNSVPRWAEIIKMFTDESEKFDQKYLKSVKFPPGVVFGHFTQVIWSKTWRVGCGYTAYTNENGYTQIYVCNFGPAGNVLKKPVYETGNTCSKCPVNSCCGKKCNSEYPGLCKMKSISEAPIYRTKDKFTFNCDFQLKKTDRNCSYSVLDSKEWKFVKALGGPYKEIVLKGGKRSTLKFKVTPSKKKGFCLSVRYRFGPALAGTKKSGSLNITLDYPRKRKPSTYILSTPTNKFLKYKMNIGWNYKTSVSIVFSVPAKDPPQFFDVQLITAKSGKC